MEPEKDAAQSAAKPIMDVAPPRSAEKQVSDATNTVAKAKELAVQLAPDQETARVSEEPAKSQSQTTTEKGKPPIPPKPDRAKSAGPVFVIVCAVIIFAVLCGLAYYAYSKQ